MSARQDVRQPVRFDGRWHLGGEIAKREFPENGAPSRIESKPSFLWRSEAPKAAPVEHCLVVLPMLPHPDISRTTYGVFRVCLVLRGVTEPQISAAVVQAVPVDVINEHAWGHVEDEPMHEDGSPPVLARLSRRTHFPMKNGARVNQTFGFFDDGVPRNLAEPLIVDIVNERGMSLRERNFSDTWRVRCRRYRQQSFADGRVYVPVDREKTIGLSARRK
jgi:hypothetical protein